MAILSADKKSVTVQKGDTLSKIAQTYASYISGSTNDARVKTLCDLNDISDPDYIVVGQKIKLSGTATTTKKNTSNKPIIKNFGLQSNTDRTVYATWAWDKSNTDSYKVMWYYSTGDGIWFKSSDEASTVKSKQSTYTAPSNATSVKFTVKPIAKKKKVNGKESGYYWTAEWSTAKIYSFSSNPPTTPPVPTVSIEGYKLTAELDNLDVNGTSIEFQVYKNDSKKVSSGSAKIKTKAAAYTCTVDAGGSYKVRCRAVRGEEYSDWSDFSSEVLSAPAAPASIKKIKALSSTSVQIDWENVSKADQYEIQYTTKKMYFDSSSSEVKTETVDATVAGHAEITGLESGQEYFFRVRAKRGEEYSSWCEIKSIKIGTEPAAPTTWSSRTTVTSGEKLVLYWVHNSEDGSTQTKAEVKTIINGVEKITPYETKTAEGEEEKTYFHEIDTTQYTEGTKIQWCVRTRGITQDTGPLKDGFSEWSVLRTVDIYTSPTLALEVTNRAGSAIGTIDSFPFYISAVAGPSTQKPIGYHVSVVANNSYETVDQIGNEKTVSKGEAVYSKYFDTDEDLLIEMSAGNIDLANNEWYRVNVTVSMNSGLTAEASEIIQVSWEEFYNAPNASIAIDPETLTASIGPYCYDDDENLIDGVLLSIYRREFDGSFVELATGIPNNGHTYITDPHPSLDYARYRIVAITEETGSVKYYDMPGVSVDEKAVVIQWAEDWTTFDSTSEDEMEEPVWSGSMLKLPYNIDVSDSFKPDVALVEYIGREHPVSYYGTQLGSTSTWNVVIPKDDIDTLYALRRLAKWMGDVYVREPSGSGYWANISVSFSQKHRDLTIPVTLDITRVAGGA